MTDSMNVRRALLSALAILVMANAAWADSRLLYAEAQLVAGHSFDGRPVRWYSMDQMDVMQKPSLGFDLVQRLSSETGDWGMFAVQARLAYDRTRNGHVEPQLYNAYLKVKPAFGDVWIGHNKPAFGLAMSLDNHGTLLQPLSMYGYGFDRDWGAGYYRDFASGNIAFSATLGSGMPVLIGKNYLFSGRISKGDLNQQNYNIGLSASYGDVLWTMGYHLPAAMSDPVRTAMVGLDGSLFFLRWESRVEAVWNTYPHDPQGMARSTKPNVVSCRISRNFLAEDRLKVEYQQSFTDPLPFQFGLSYRLTSDLTLRGSFGSDGDNDQAVAQLYWYHKI